jgi:eukaryotic-like serine/threonine-protein kinase
LIDQTISHYRITGRLGSGGMGVVYEAQDLNLERKVALKFLPPELSRDQNALERFLFEARTASALNHPNICTIYAVEKAALENGAEQSFIAMELLEGQSLDQKLFSGPLPLDRLLDVAVQLADALDAAHAKGIIHRDIKPANISLSPRGQVKVLDFGLAKLSAREMRMDTIGVAQIDATQDAPAHLTSRGATVGTIAYMSPEQARGEELDTRTDLFSLGAVIYEMATGRQPFSGATSAVIFHAILERTPVSALHLNTALPSRLQEILEKALEKDRELRYQSAADLRGDLKRLKRDTESGKRASQSVSSARPAAADAQGAAHPTSSGAAVVAAARQNKFGTGVTLLSALALAAAAVYGVFAFVTRSHPAPFQNISVTKVTDSGDAVLAAISPDGQYILSLTRRNGLASLWLRNVPTNSNAQVQPEAEVYYNGLRFSPEGNYFYFVRSDPGNSELKFLYRSPLLGGTPQKLAEDVDSNVTFSPDGKRLAFMRYDNPERGEYQLILRPVEGGAESALASGSTSESLYQPTWSADGKTIVCQMFDLANGFIRLIAIDVDSARRTVFFSSNDRLIDRPTWLPGGNGVLGIVREQSTNFTRNQIGFVSYPKGVYSPVTRDTNSYSDLSIAGSGHVLATVQNQGRWSLQVVAGDAPAAQTQQAASADSDTNFTWTADNRLISDQANVLNLIDPASGSKTVVPGQAVSAAPRACGAAGTVVFVRFQNGAQDIWRMDAGGGNFRQITHGKLDLQPMCSPDGKWVFYLNQADQSKLTKIPIDGGEAQVVSDLPNSGTYDVSPDGKLAAFATLEHSGEHKEMLALVETDGGKVAKLDGFERPRFGVLRFSRDGKAAVYPTRENGIDNLWLQPLDGSKGKQITEFKGEHIFDFHWSFDGKQLAFIRGHTDSDVVLIRDMP